MRLDELRDRLDEAADDGAAPEYGVIIILENLPYGVGRVEYDNGGAVRIYLE